MNWNTIIRNVYYLLKRITKGLTLLLNELTKPTSYLKGDDFETCLRNKVYTNKYFDLVMKTHDFHENQADYVESSLYPDYLFRNKVTGEEFWVEAKYRENLYKGKIEWCSKYQFKRYKKISNNANVIIAIGFGGRPKNPESIYLIPLQAIEYTGLYPNQLTEYEFKENRKNVLDSVMDKAYNYQ